MIDPFNRVAAHNAAARILRRVEVMQKCGLSKTSLYKLEKAGDFPQHFMLTPRCCAWYEHDVNAWIELRRGTAVASAPPPDVSQRKSRGARKPTQPEIGQIRRALTELQRLVDQWERATFKTSDPSIGTCWPAQGRSVVKP